MLKLHESVGQGSISRIWKKPPGRHAFPVDDAERNEVARTSHRVARMRARARCFLGGSFESGLHLFDLNFPTHAVLLNLAALAGRISAA
jgi:hypothetical protein